MHYTSGMPTTPLEWTLTILASLLGYELVRWAIVRRIKGRLRAGALSYVRRHRVELESARFIDRLWLRETLLMDPEVDQVVLAQSQEEGIPLRQMRHRVGLYVDEIAPAFSITAYYRVGRLIAGTIVRFTYEVIFDDARFRRVMAEIPPGARVVFVMNHRSNFDYLVLSYGLLKHVALSYAVGEWAQVWPLDKLFKAFGSYFVRRGEKDPVYHRVLERFIQLLVGHGGVTGFFLEGRVNFLIAWDGILIVHIEARHNHHRAIGEHGGITGQSNGQGMGLSHAAKSIDTRQLDSLHGLFLVEVDVGQATDHGRSHIEGITTGVQRKPSRLIAYRPLSQHLQAVAVTLFDSILS